MKSYYVYIMSNQTDSTLYVGVTANLERRSVEHKEKMRDGFTKRYNISKLVYAEKFENVNDAIAREKQIKKWRREKKNALVQSVNPEWNDLFEVGF